MPFWLHESFFATIASAVLALYALFRDPRDPRNRAFAGFATTVSTISFASLMVFHAPDETTADFWAGATCWTFMFLPHFLLAFTLHLTELGSRVRRPVLRSSLVTCTAFALLTFSPWFVLGYWRDGPYIKPTYGPVYQAFALYTAVILLGCIGWMLRRRPGQSAYLRARIWMLLLGMATGVGIAILSFYLMSVVRYPLTTLGFLAGLGLMAHSFMSDGVWGPQSYLRQLGTFLVLGLVLLLPFFAQTLGALHAVYGSTPPGVVTVLFVSFLILGWFGQRAREHADAVLLHLRRSEPDATTKALMDGARHLFGLPSVEAVAEESARLMADHGAARWATLFHDRRDRQGMVRLGLRGPEVQAPTRFRHGEEGLGWLVAHQGPVLIHDLLQPTTPDAVRDLAVRLEAIGAEVVLPIKQLGCRALLLLGPRSDARIWEPPDLAPLHELAGTVATALLSAMRYQREHERRQIEQVARWAGALAPHVDDADLSGQLRLIEDPPCAVSTHCDLLELARQALHEQRARARQPSPPVILEAPEGPVPGVFDQQRISRVIGHLIAHGIAHADRAPVRLEIAADAHEAATTALVTVWIDADTEEQNLSRVFTPDRDARGPGAHALDMHLPIAWSLAHSHGGSLMVRSRPGEGTTLVLSLPLGGGPG